MPDYFEIVYVNTYEGEGAGDFPGAAARIRDWSWEQSAYVRWSYTSPNELDSMAGADLVILDWSNRNANLARTVCQQIRSSRADLPLFILKSDSGRAPSRGVFLAKDSHALLLSDEQTATSARIAETFEDFHLVLAQPILELHPQQDWSTNTFIEWVDRERLALTIQKYFPHAKDAYLVSVGGGWSDARLCRLFIDNEPDEYFLKFFTDRETYTSELLQHESAAKWLGPATVELRLIPNMKGGLIAQNEAFPDIRPPRFPVCYQSASTRTLPRQTLRVLYRDQPDNFLEGAFGRLIKILETDQPCYENSEPPWSDSSRVGFSLTPQNKVSILETIQDLSMYGPRIYGDTEWVNVQNTIQEFLYQNLPPKLFEPSFVVIGHTHGDPNPRNCLVNPGNYDDILLIDCGEYKQGGRLVSDLALLERDIKLLLMGTERSASQFLDLDIAKLAEWSHNERDSVSRGLSAKPDSAPGSLTTAKRAFRLVGHVRQRASQLAGDKDAEGRHYFGALLFWTLDALKYPAIRPTKKLFALYSAAELISLLR